MKCKVFSETDATYLEKKINEFLQTEAGFLFDINHIKYSTCACGHNIFYSALIIYT